MFYTTDSSKPVRVLIIEADESDGRMFAEVVRRRLKAEVQIVRDGIDGLRQCLADPPDLLILDLVMPRLRGEEICRLVRSTRGLHDLPIVVVSGVTESKRQQIDSIGLAADTYLERPISTERLMQAISSALVERDLLRSLESIPMEKSRTSSDGIALPVMKTPTAESAADTEIKAGRAQAPKTPPSQQRRWNDSSESVSIHHAGGVATPAPGDKTSIFDPPREGSGEVAGYQLLEIIGRGGMGTVYRAIQTSLDRVVAIKILLSDFRENMDFRERFRREALIMGKLHHPNIVRVYDVGSREHNLYIVMEFVKGCSLWHRLHKTSRAPLTWDEKLTIADQMFQAVSYLHGEGVVHRDIKPTNVLLNEQGEVKLVDFGVSRAVDNRWRASLTTVQAVIGTPQYMSPEAARGEVATERSDLYSLGLTTYFMFSSSGKATPNSPLEDDTVQVFPAAVAEVLSKCYSPIADQRYDTVKEAREELLKAAGRK